MHSNMGISCGSRLAQRHFGFILNSDAPLKEQFDASGNACNICKNDIEDGVKNSPKLPPLPSARAANFPQVEFFLLPSLVIQ